MDKIEEKVVRLEGKIEQIEKEQKEIKQIVNETRKNCKFCWNYGKWDDSCKKWCFNYKK